MLTALLVLVAFTTTAWLQGTFDEGFSEQTSCDIDRLGIPACGAYLGAAVGGNSSPVAFEKSVGGRLGVRRTYYASDQVSEAVNTARDDLSRRRLPWISFKMPYSWAEMAAGTGDSWTENLARQLGELDGPVWLAFHHEPEGDGDIEDWREMQRHLAPIIHRDARNVAYTIIVTGYNQLFGPPELSLDAIWPGDGLVDVLAFDIYDPYLETKNGKILTKAVDLDTVYFKPLAEFAAEHDVPWALGETGLTDRAAEDYPHWVSETFRAMQQRGGIAMAYFNSELNSESTWQITTETKRQQFAEALQLSARLPAAS